MVQRQRVNGEANDNVATPLKLQRAVSHGSAGIDMSSMVLCSASPHIADTSVHPSVYAQDSLSPGLLSTLVVNGRGGRKQVQYQTAFFILYLPFSVYLNYIIKPHIMFC